jgi:regulator of protease activity HflC (stomatin/prohibitin superfamily)
MKQPNTNQPTVPDRRGEAAALLGGVLSLIATAVLGVLAVWSSSTAVWALSFQMLGTVGIWVLTLIQLHQQRLVAEERLEVADLEHQRRERLARHGGSSSGPVTIFEEQDLQQMEILTMGRRLAWIERIVVPVLAIGIALFHIAAGLAVLPWKYRLAAVSEAAAGPVEHASVILFFAGGIAFICFMISRYSLGMSKVGHWALLRAGGDYAFGAAATCLAVSISLIFVIGELPLVEKYLAYGIGVLMILVAAETIINFILDFYRPRIAGQIQRPFYDSRFVGMFSEPAGILKSVANAMDYQFGFKVSQTWFYQLLTKAMPKLVAFEIAVILALTSIVVVPPGHRALIEHFGKCDGVAAAPGIHFTWPWPIDRATVIEVERIRRLEVGYEVDEEKKNEPSEGPILWTKRHYKKEYLLLVADRNASSKRDPRQENTALEAADAASRAPVSLVSINMPVQWRVKAADQEVARFYTQGQKVDDLVESLAFRELTKYAAQADILDLLGKKGIESEQSLRDNLQRACDQSGTDGKGLGVEIVHVGIGGIHPPPDEEVAQTYEDVVSAFETRDSKIKEAEGEAARIRVSSAGLDWLALHQAIVAEDEAERSKSPDLPKRTADVERMLREVVGGNARSSAAYAELNAWKKVFEGRAAAQLYDVQLKAWEQAPRAYTLRSYLRLLEEGLKDIRKFMIVLADSGRIIYEIDLKPPLGLDTLTSEVNALESKGK